jgi:membrane protein YdbS with pleckstrin-like domain
MWDATVWAAMTWLKLTALLAVAVGVCWLVFGAGSGGFVLAVIVDAVVELYLTRQLAREWAYEATMRWWWSP